MRWQPFNEITHGSFPRSKSVAIAVSTVSYWSILDALLLDGYRIADIVGYAISRTDKGALVRRYDGEKLLGLHRAIDFDPRGIR